MWSHNVEHGTHAHAHIYTHTPIPIHTYAHTHTHTHTRTYIHQSYNHSTLTILYSQCTVGTIVQNIIYIYI